MTSPPPSPGPADAPRSGMVAVVGRANVGKSTLVNALLGEKVSIVSPVAQTTRNLIRGVLTEPRGQICFLDTPGVHRAQSDLGRVMNRTARTAIEGVDAILFVVDGSRQPRIEDDGWIRRLRRETAPVLAALNKCDQPEDHAGEYLARWDNTDEGAPPRRDIEWLPISAREGQGLETLLDRLFALMPPGPHLFPDDLLTDFPRRLTIADVIREKLFAGLDEEMPHQVAVWVEGLVETDDGWDVSAVIYVQRPGQKGIVIGHKGRLLRRVRRAAEAELAEMYERPVRLNLWVKVEKNWARNFWLLKKFGYVE